MAIITLRLKNQKEWAFLSDLLKRLNISFDRIEEKTATETPQMPSENDVIAQLYGSWTSDESADDIIKSLRDARVNQTRDIEI